MKIKRILATVLAALLLLPMLAFGADLARAEGTEDIWTQIEALEDDALSAKKSISRTAEDYAQLSDRVETLAADWSGYVSDSLVRSGDVVYWKGTDGITYGYSPDLRAKMNSETFTGASSEDAAATLKGGKPGSTDIAVFQPFYGIDTSFTDQYADEGYALADVTGGDCTVYRTYSATIDTIADAIESSAVVIFDSHGTTGWSSGSDYTSQAESSFLCICSSSGITSKDMDYVYGKYGYYPHAWYGGTSGGASVYCIDGTAITNHMERQAPNNFVWNAICLGMATDGLEAPLRANGVEVVYGYSQSVTFGCDFLWEESFWGQMKQGATVKQAASAMKNEVGTYDWIDVQYNHSTRPAYPIFASSEDPYPGQGKVDAVQTVKSTWLLKGISMSNVNITLNKNDVQYKGKTPYVVYNRQAQKPRVIVKNKSGQTVDPSLYTVTYRSNTDPGTAYIDVKMKDSGESATVFFKIYLAAPETTTVKNVQNGIQVSWKKVDGAKGYVIYRRAWNLKDAGWTTFERWNNTTATTWTDTKVYAGTRYQYGVKAYFADPMDNYNLGLIGPLKTTVRITTRTLNKVEPGSKRLTVKWTGSTLFTGYQIQIATDKDFTKDRQTITINKPKTYETTIKNLKGKTTYYVRVRSYHVFDGTTYYGGWSNVLDGKTK